jgi:hypothetical protein
MRWACPVKTLRAMHGYLYGAVFLNRHLDFPRMVSRKNVKRMTEPRSTAAAAILRVANERAVSNIAPIIAEIRAGGVTSLLDIAARLNQRGITTARGGTWSAKQVARVLARSDLTK